MNEKRILKYQIISYIIILIVVAIGLKVDHLVATKGSISLTMSYYYLGYGFKYLISITVGILVGIDRFLVERDKFGKWKFQGTRFVIVSILPTFYLLRFITIILAYSFSISTPFSLYRTFGNAFLVASNQGESIMLAILGFVFISSFYKDKENVVEGQVK